MSTHKKSTQVQLVAETQQIAPKPPQPQTTDEESIPLYELEHGLVEAMNTWLEATIELDSAVPEGGIADPGVVATALDAELEAKAVVQAYLDGAVAKRDKIGAYMAHLKAREEYLDGQIKRMQAAKKRTTRKLEGLQGYVVSIMRATGSTRISGNDWEFSLRLNPPSVNVYNESAIPYAYRREPGPPPPDKTKIKQYLLSEAKAKAAELALTNPGDAIDKTEYGDLVTTTIPGAHLVTSKYSLTVR